MPTARTKNWITRKCRKYGFCEIEGFPLLIAHQDYGFGYPTVKGTGARTEIISERWRAGDSMEEICYDFGVTEEQAREAMAFEFAS